MAAVADHDDFAARGAHLRDFDVHLGDERTGRVEHAQTPCLGLAAHGLRDAVGAEDHGAARGNLAKRLDEHGAFALQVLDHVFVVHDLVADVDRRAVDRERALDDADRALDTGAKTAWIGEQDFHGRLF